MPATVSARRAGSFSISSQLSKCFVVVVISAASLISQSAQGQDFKLAYSFEDPPDGSGPASILVVNNGIAYGTTVGGGADGDGTIFELTSSGKETVVYSFAGGVDGKAPGGALAKDAKGDLYGTTEEGGSCGDLSGYCGTVFKLDAGKESVVYTFQAGTGDAENPLAGVVIDASGNLYGPAGGGAHNDGAVFKIDGISGKETVLYSFGTNAGDGVNPAGSLTLDSEGNIYGATQEGGSCGGGTIFQITPSGAESTLYSFCSFSSTGSTPSGPLVRDKSGNLYGPLGKAAT